jgi:hypothetical protein
MRNQAIDTAKTLRDNHRAVQQLLGDKYAEKVRPYINLIEVTAEANHFLPIQATMLLAESLLASGHDTSLLMAGLVDVLRENSWVACHG